jgi:SAM-dependent methyltransferase
VAQRPWYVDFFDDDYLELFLPFLTAERTAAEVRGVVDLLGLAPPARVLDLCCGHGRHAIPLAGLGYRVAGVDLNPRFLQRGARAAAGHGVAVGLVAADMRRLPFTGGRFDAVVNLFNAFGYLESEAEDERVLAEVARVLAPGGRFVQEMANREAVVRGWRDIDATRYQDGRLMVEERDLDLRSSRDRVRYTVLHPDGRLTSADHSIRLYTLTELAAMLARSGLELEAVHGGLDGGPLELDSSFLFTVSRRPGAPGPEPVAAG